MAEIADRLRTVSYCAAKRQGAVKQKRAGARRLGPVPSPASHRCRLPMADSTCRIGARHMDER